MRWCLDSERRDALRQPRQNMQGSAGRPAGAASWTLTGSLEILSSGLSSLKHLVRSTILTMYAAVSYIGDA